MLGLVLAVLYLIFTFNGFHASELPKSHRKHTRNQKMTRINTVEPLDDVDTLKTSHAQMALHLKLKEIFASQHPSDKYNLRAYEIENWPQCVDVNDSHYWKRNDMILINEGIPFYRFVPREIVPNTTSSTETASNNTCSTEQLHKGLKSMKCMKGTVLNEEYKLKLVRDLLFDRFKEESGRPYSKKIDWLLLNRSQIPKKYENVPLNSKSLRYESIYKNPEIVDNIHFFDCLNPNRNNTGISNGNLAKVEIRSSELENEIKDSITQDNGNEYFSDKADDLEDFEIGNVDLDFDITNDDMEKMLRTLNDSSVDVIIDECQSERSVEFTSEQEPDLKTSPTSSLCHKNIYELRSIIKADLNALFKAQHPNDELKMRQYDVINWPEYVGLNSTKWNRNDIKILCETMDKFVFVKRSTKSQSYSETRDIIFERYRQESGDSDALKINWKLLDRRAIPSKYDGIEINSRTIQSQDKNPEIVDNIHFFKAKKVEKIERKRKISDECNI